MPVSSNLEVATYSSLKVECKHEAVKMTLGRHNKYFEESTDSAVIEEILDGYGLKGTVQATTVTHKELVQQLCHRLGLCSRTIRTKWPLGFCGCGKN